MNSITSIEIYPVMRVYRNELPHYRDGGLTWNELCYIGLLEWKNRRKFNRENELYELVKDLKELD